MNIQEIINNLENAKPVDIKEVFEAVPADSLNDVKNIQRRMFHDQALIYLLGSTEIFPDKNKGIEAICRVLKRVPADKSRDLSISRAKRFYESQRTLHQTRLANGRPSSLAAYESELASLFGESPRSIPSGNGTPGYFGASSGKLYRTS